MTTATIPMNPELAVLARELFAFTDGQLDRPTSVDRTKFMALRGKIKNFERGKLSATDVTDLDFLYVVSTMGANRQEDFYERNDNKFTDGKEF